MVRIITIISLLFCVSALGQQPSQDLSPDQVTNNPASTTDNQENAQIEEPDAAAGQQPSVGQTTDNENQQSTNPDPQVESNRIAAQDLLEQNRMADGTWWIVALTGVTILLVWMTYREARSANKIIGAASKSQLRAYMTINDVIIEEIESSEYRLRVEWINSGETPAMMAQVSADMERFAREKDGNSAEEISAAVKALQAREPVFNSGVDIGKGRPIGKNLDDFINHSRAKAVFQDRQSIVVRTLVIYSDIDGNRYQGELFAKIKLLASPRSRSKDCTYETSIRPIRPYIREKVIARSEEPPT